MSIDSKAVHRYRWLKRWGLVLGGFLLLLGIAVRRWPERYVACSTVTVPSFTQNALVERLIAPLNAKDPAVVRTEFGISLAGFHARANQERRGVCVFMWAVADSPDAAVSQARRAAERDREVLLHSTSAALVEVDTSGRTTNFSMLRDSVFPRVDRVVAPRLPEGFPLCAWVKLREAIGNSIVY